MEQDSFQRNSLPRFNALLVEGIPGVGKSTLIDALVRRHIAQAAPRQVRTLVHLCQAHTLGPLAPGEDAGTLTTHDNLEHLERLCGLLEWLHAAVVDNKKPSCFVLVDTLHLTHCLRPGILKWPEVANFDRRLAALGCKLLLLRASAEVIWDRSIKARSDWSFLRVYAAKFGRTDEDLHRYFIREQEQFSHMFEQSRLPKLLLANDGGLEQIQDAAHDFWYRSSVLQSRATKE